MNNQVIYKARIKDSIHNLEEALKLKPQVFREHDKITKIIDVLKDIDEGIMVDENTKELVTKFNKEDIKACIRTHMHMLILPDDIDPFKLLWAICGEESSFGQNVKKRYEPIYGPGGKYYNQSLRIQQDYKLYGKDACSSWGPWQIMYPTARELGFKKSPYELHGMEESIPYVIKYINKRAIERGAKTVTEIADAYNTGTHRDNIHNYKYEREVKAIYDSL